MATKKSAKAKTATTGIINAPGVKPPRLKPSKAGFNWPERRGVASDHRKAFSVFLRKAMERTNDTHITLAKKFWGVTSVGGTNGQQIARWLRMEMLPSRIVAEHVAHYFDASLEDMLSDPGEYADPSHLIVSKSGKPVGSTPAPKARAAARAAAPAAAVAVAVAAAPTKRPYNKKKTAATNGHDAEVLDPRWKLPAGVPAPRILLDLVPDSPGRMTKVQIEAYVPPEVAMALYTTLVEHRPPSPSEVIATVHSPPLVGNKSLPPE